MKKIFSILVAFTVFISCEKETALDSAHAIIIESISPKEARAGDTVTLFGKNLLFAAAEASIILGPDSILLLDKTDNMIRFIVPEKFQDTRVDIKIGDTILEGLLLQYRTIARVTTIAGNGYEGSQDGAGANASFKCPWGLAFDNQNHLFVADSYNRLIRKIDVTQPDYPVNTININVSGFYSPYNLAVDSNNQSIFVTDFNTHILKVDGNGNQSVIYSSPTFKSTSGIVVGPDHMLYVGDNINHKIFRIDQDGGNESTVASVMLPRNLLFYNNKLFASSTDVVQIEDNGQHKYIEDNTSFQGWEVAFDKNGDFYQADHFRNTISKVNRKTGQTRVIAGSGAAADTDGVGTTAAFNGPMSIVIDANGDLYVSTYNFDTAGGNKIRKISFE